MALRLSNRTTIITGASSGIGRAIALLFAKHGASVVCSDLRGPSSHPAEKGVFTDELIRKEGGKATFMRCDVTKAEEVKDLVERGQKWGGGRLDVMVNNAGVSLDATNPRSIWEYPEEQFDKTLAINLRGVFLGCKYASAQMKKQEARQNGDRGWIINMASIFGLGGGPLGGSYITSKHGVMGLTKAAAWDCAPHRIHVNAVCPGFTRTAQSEAHWEDPEKIKSLEAMHPFRGLGKPEDIAYAALFLASDEASWITGIGLPVDGGWSSQ